MKTYPTPTTQRRLRRFAIIFAVCFAAAFSVLLLPPVQFADSKFSASLVSVSHALVERFGGRAAVEGAIMRAPSGFAVEMRDGCNAVNVTILLWCAVIAFPAPWKTKVLGLAAGSLAIQAVNVVRFISLFYLGQYSVTWFDFAHGYLWESLIVLDTMVIFWLWVTRVASRVSPHHAGA